MLYLYFLFLLNIYILAEEKTSMSSNILPFVEIKCPSTPVTLVTKPVLPSEGTFFCVQNIYLSTHNCERKPLLCNKQQI